MGEGDKIDNAGHYNAQFFATQSEGSLRSARIVLENVFELLPPQSVIDVGCGVGSWLKAARELGASDTLGLDGEYVDRTNLLIDQKDFIVSDLANCSIFDSIPKSRVKKFDLAMSLEVAEHLPYAASERFIEDLTGLSDVILFSAAVPFQAGSNHINEQWPEFWAIHFSRRDFICHDVLRRHFWYNSDVEWWYSQNIFLYARRGSKADHILNAAKFHGQNAPLSLVHPQNLLFQVLNAFRSQRAAAREEEVSDFIALAGAYARGAGHLPELAAPLRASRAAPGAPDVFPSTRITVSVPENDLASRDAMIAELTAEVAAKQARVADCSAELASVTELLQLRGEQLETTRDLLNRRWEELMDAHSRLERQEKDLSALRNALEVQRQAAQQALARLQAIDESRLWRATLHLRQVVNRIRQKARALRNTGVR